MKVWPVEITFSKKIRTYVEAANVWDAGLIARAAALDMDVLDTVGSDFDDRQIEVSSYFRDLEAISLDDEAYVWRAGEKWPLCDSVGDRLAELAEDAK